MIYIYVASLYNSPLVDRNESGIIADVYIYKLNLALFCLLISMLINIVSYVCTAVICNKTYLNVFFFKFCSTTLLFSTINLLKLTYDCVTS